MRYLITQRGLKPFFTNWFDLDNHYSDEMIVYDLVNKTYCDDGITWNLINEDHL